jgi:hypothetical protein
VEAAIRSDEQTFRMVDLLPFAFRGKKSLINPIAT